MSNLDGINFYGDRSITEVIEHNVIDFMRYGLLEVGAFYNISTGQLDYNGNDESILKPLSRPDITGYTMYGGKKNDWVWESGINLKYDGGSQPIRPSGIFVNGVFYATGTTIEGTGYFHDYSRGRVVFDNPLPSSYVVTCPHTLRWVQVYSDTGPEYKSLVYDWMDRVQSSGTINKIDHHAYLPAVFVGLNGYRTLRGTHLGNRTKLIRAEMEFNVLANNAMEAKKIADFCHLLEEKHITAYDPNTAIKPLDYEGRLVNPTGTWVYLTNNYPYTNPGIHFSSDARIQRIRSELLPIYRYKITVGLEMDVFPG